MAAGHKTTLQAARLASKDEHPARGPASNHEVSRVSTGEFVLLVVQLGP